MASRLSAIVMSAFIMGGTAGGYPCRAESAAAPVRAPASDTAQDSAQGTADAAALTSAHDEFWTAYASRDLWKMSSLWDKGDPAISAAFTAAAGPATGWDNISESFRRTFSHNRDIKIDAKTIRVDRQGDVAWILGAVRFEAIQTQTGQYVLLDRMLTTEIFRRTNGVWKLVHYHGHYPGFLPPRSDPTTMITTVARPPVSASDVWTVHNRFLAAFSALDLGDMFQIVTPEKDASAFQPTSPVPFIGPQNVMASWKKTFADIQAVTIEPQTVVVKEAGTIAWISELDQYHIVFKAQPNTIQHFHNVMATYIFRKEAGDWQLVHYHAHLGFSFEDHNH